MGFSILYIPFPDQKTARKITKALLKERIIACANSFPIESGFWWKDEITREGEWVSIVKTRKKLAKKVEKFVLENHPYEIPCILKMEVEANESYEKWIREQTKQE